MKNRYRESNPELFSQLEQLIINEPCHYGSLLKNTYKHVFDWCVKELDAVGCHPTKKKVIVYFILHGLTDYPDCAICKRKLKDKDLINVQKGFHRTCSTDCSHEYFSKFVLTDEWRRNHGESIHQSYKSMSDDRRQKWISSIRSYRANETREQKDARIQSYKDTVNQRTDEQKKIVSQNISKALQSMTEQQKIAWRNSVSAGLANMSDEAKESRNRKIGKKNSMNYNAKSEEEKARFRENQRIASANRTPETLQKMVDKCTQTKRKNGSFNTSQPEETTYDLLIGVFGNDDVLRQYNKDVRYPFAADFYIKSLDLFIECNYSWTHGGHWFNSQSPEDQKRATMLYSRYENTGKKYYKNAADTWTIRDVKKHSVALQNSLNYLVFWELDEAMKYDFDELKTKTEIRK